MPRRMAFCSACDRPVPVLIRPGAGAHVPPRIEDAADIVCLDFGVRCTGAMCPLFSTPDDEPPADSGRSRRRTRWRPR